MRFIRLNLALISLVLINPLAHAAEKKVYRSVDNQGNVVFSDTASGDAVEIKIEKTITYDSSLLARPTSRPLKELTRPNLDYLQLNITSPVNDEAIRSNNGNVQILFEMTPVLYRGHSIQLLVDGVVTHTTKVVAAISLNNLDRGTHQISLQIIEDKSGKVVFSGNAVTTTILRHSVLHNRQPASSQPSLRTRLVRLFQ